MVHNRLCFATNGGFLYECHCHDEDYLDELLDRVVAARYN